MNKPSAASIAVFGGSAGLVAIAFGILLYLSGDKTPTATIARSPIACQAVPMGEGSIGIVLGAAARK